jgi:hypothetical protein
MSAANGFHVLDKTAFSAKSTIQNRLTREEDGSEFEEVMLYVYSIKRNKYLTRGELEAELDALHAFRQKEAHSQSEKAVIEEQVSSASPKLTAAQKRVLKALVHGWKAVPNGPDKFLYIKGKRACKIESMLILKGLGLVEFDENRRMWRISETGRQIGGKL